jgi:hypothetical protein
MSEYLDIAGNGKKDTIETLGKLSQRKPLSQKEAESYFNLYTIITAGNLTALQKGGISLSGELLSFPFMDDNNGKDLDLAFFNMDYEVDSGMHASGLKDAYLDYSQKAGINLFKNLVNSGTISKETYNSLNLESSFVSQVRGHSMAYTMLPPFAKWYRTIRSRK